MLTVLASQNNAEASDRDELMTFTDNFTPDASVGWRFVLRYCIKILSLL